MFVQNFIKLRAAVYELWWDQRNTKKLSDDAENNTAVASAASKKRRETKIGVNVFKTSCRRASFQQKI